MYYQDGNNVYESTASERSNDPFLIGNELSFINNKAYRASSAARSTADLIVDMATAPMSFDDYKPQEPPVFDINSIVLPPPNFSCYVEPPVSKGTVSYFKHTEPTMCRTLTLNFNTSKTVVRENVIHHQHTQNVITNVIRNHWHTQRVVVKDNNYHHYLINNVVKISDVHHQKIEHVRGEGKSFKDFKQTQKIEAALCDFSDREAKIVEYADNSRIINNFSNESSSSPNDADGNSSPATGQIKLSSR